VKRHVSHILSRCRDSKVVWERYISLSLCSGKRALNVRRMNDCRRDVKGHAVRHAVTDASHISWTTAACWVFHTQFKQMRAHDVAGCLWRLLCLQFASRRRSVNNCTGGHVNAQHLIRPTADRYSCTVGISVSVKTRKPIYRIRDTAMQRVNTQRHGISA